MPDFSSSRLTPKGSATGAFRFQAAARKKRMALRDRLGLLKNKAFNEPLDDVEKKMMEHELAIAAELQSNLLPKRIPRIPPYDISAYYKPCEDVGGDYYDFIEVDQDRLGILVADVSGKGIPGSMVMTETRALIRCEGARIQSPAEVLIKVNRFLHQDIKRGMFVSAFYAILEPRKALMTFTSAGHNPMVLWRMASNSISLVNTSGLALGIDKGPLFEKNIKEYKIQLFNGDRVVLYTDGVTEAMNAENEPLGPMRFYQTVRQFAPKKSSEFISLLVDTVERHKGAAPQHDDITVVTVQLKPPEDPNKDEA